MFLIHPFLLIIPANIRGKIRRKNAQNKDFSLHLQTQKKYFVYYVFIVWILFNIYFKHALNPCLNPFITADNRSKIRRKNAQNKDFSMLTKGEANHYHRLSPQLLLATLQYMSTGKKKK